MTNLNLGLGNLRISYKSRAMDSILNIIINTDLRPGISDKKVVAKSPLLPNELIYAFNAIAYNPYFNETIFHTIIENKAIYVKKALDAGMSREFNPWNLTMLGSAINGEEAINADIYAAMCGCGDWDDQVVKSFQLMAYLKNKPIRFIEVPRFDAMAEKSAKNFLKMELKQFFEWMALNSHTNSNKSQFEQVIKKGNQIRHDMHILDNIISQHPGILPSIEFYLVQSLLGDYGRNPEELHQKYQMLISELVLKAKETLALELPASSKLFKVYLAGEFTQEFDLLTMIEKYGGVLVGCDAWLPLYYKQIDESLKPQEALSDYIWNMPANLGTANRTRITIEHIRRQGAHGVIINNINKSKAISCSEKLMKDVIREEAGLPVLSVETSLPGECSDTLDYQLRAFIEMNQ